MPARVSAKFARQHMPSAFAALKNNEPARISEIRDLKRQIKRLLKKGEAVYVEHSAGNARLI